MNKRLSTWYRKYRIVTDSYAGYEVQCWRIWFPFWIQINGINTSDTVEEARAMAERHSNEVVEYL